MVGDQSNMNLTASGYQTADKYETVSLLLKEISEIYFLFFMYCFGWFIFCQIINDSCSFILTGLQHNYEATGVKILDTRDSVAPITIAPMYVSSVSTGRQN